MLTGAQCTIYAKNPDGGYTRQTADCHWEDMRGLSFNQTGVQDADTVFVMIPLDAVELPIISSTGNRKNFLLRGVFEDELLDGEVSEFMKTHDVLTITAVERNDYSLGMADNHWAVYAK